MGVAWLIVMDRYGVNHPDQIPEPRRLIPIEMAEETNVADGSVESVIDDYPTRPVSRTKILSLLK
jgi:hypothetical protein